MATKPAKRLKSYFPPLSEDALEAKIKMAKRDLWCIAVNQTQDLAFGNMYFTQYNLVNYKKGPLIYDYIVELLRRMSLRMRSEAYYNAVQVISAVANYMNRTYVVNARRRDVMGCALAAYERPVARRWRRAIAIVRWEARLRKWRVSFVEAWLRPGGSGARSLAKRFAEHASVHNNNTNR